MREKKEVGIWGEELALEYLLQRGYRMRASNWRSGHLELDLGMEDERCIRIVEVRSRTKPAQVLPHLTVNRHKQVNLFKAASAYVRQYRISKDVVFDLVTVLFDERGYEIDYFPEAFYPFW